MLMKPNKEWIGTYHPVYGKIEDKEYDVRPEHKDEPMWQGIKKEVKKEKVGEN